MSTDVLPIPQPIKTTTERRHPPERPRGLTDTAAAWLSGLWDGEGSVGLTKVGTTYIMQCQISMTCPVTIARASTLLLDCGVTHTYLMAAEKQQVWYKPAHRLYITRMQNCVRLSNVLRPYAITKAEHWKLLDEWITMRVKAGGGYNAQGIVRRRSMPYSAADLVVADAIRGLHKRTVRPDVAA